MAQPLEARATTLEQLREERIYLAYNSRLQSYHHRSHSGMSFRAPIIPHLQPSREEQLHPCYLLAIILPALLTLSTEDS